MGSEAEPLRVAQAESEAGPGPDDWYPPDAARSVQSAVPGWVPGVSQAVGQAERWDGKACPEPVANAGDQREPAHVPARKDAGAEPGCRLGAAHVQPVPGWDGRLLQVPPARHSRVGEPEGHRELRRPDPRHAVHVDRHPPPLRAAPAYVGAALPHPGPDGPGALWEATGLVLPVQPGQR